VRLITDDTGGVVGSSAFDAFGNRTHTGTADSAFGFTGNWTDPGTGLLYLRARDYDPATGQFLSVDPAVDATRQPYAYTGNSPLLLTDPTGLDAWDELGAFGLGALDGLTFGVSSAVLGALVPGYDCFVSAHAVAFTAGSVTATVVQAAVMVVATLGAGAGLAVGLVVLRTVAKSAVKAVAKAIEKAVVKSAERAAVRTAEKSVTNEGIYVVRSATGTYVGQSGNIAQRLTRHVSNDKFTQAEVDAAERIFVSGGKTVREIAEQMKIDELGGIDNLLNKLNPIGPRRFELMPNQPYIR
jgi:RHS repeat-associated protein